MNGEELAPCGAAMETRERKEALGKAAAREEEEEEEEGGMGWRSGEREKGFRASEGAKWASAIGDGLR